MMNSTVKEDLRVVAKVARVGMWWDNVWVYDKWLPR